MHRLLLVLLLFFIISCKKSKPPSGDYYGKLQLKEMTYRFYLKYAKPNPTLVNITFWPQEISLDTLFFSPDTLQFRLKNFYSEYRGSYDHSTDNIKGYWISEDSISYPLTFIPVLADTLQGLHPRGSKAYHYQPPPAQDDNIPVCTLNDQHIRQSRIDSLMDAILSEHYGTIHSMLIARNNCLVAEEYFYGFHRGAHFGIQSATKSFTSALTGIALEKDEIKSVNESLCDYFSDYRELACNEQNRSITLDQLLSMTTGLAWDEITYDYMEEQNSNAIAGKQPDQYRYLLGQPRTNKRVFAYNSLNHLLMNNVLHNATKMENTVEITERLLSPLGITNYDLGKPTNGIIGDIFLRPRDMLKFGLLYLNEGRWNGKQVVPSDWVKQSTTTKIELEPGFGYGYFWWTKQFPWKGKMVDSYFAWGYGGQYIFVVPSLQLVAVFSGSNWSTDPKRFSFEIMEKFILAACE